MDTKQCRHCKQPIHAEARVCQHCQSSQSWLANQRDPRSLAVIMAVFVIVILPLVFLTLRIDSPATSPAEMPTLTVADGSLRFVATPDGPRVFALGKVHNSSSHDASRMWIRVNLYGDANRLLDSFLMEANGVVVPSGQTVPFRVTSLVSVQETDVKRNEVIVERSKTRTKWD